MELQSMANLIIKEDDKKARELPIEVKQAFWRAFYEDEKTLGEARMIAGIGDVGVAVSLVVQCHKQYTVPMGVDEIE